MAENELFGFFGIYIYSLIHRFSLSFSHFFWTHKLKSFSLLSIFTSVTFYFSTFLSYNQTSLSSKCLGKKIIYRKEKSYILSLILLGTQLNLNLCNLMILRNINHRLGCKAFTEIRICVLIGIVAHLVSFFIVCCLMLFFFRFRLLIILRNKINVVIFYWFSNIICCYGKMLLW